MNLLKNLVLWSGIFFSNGYAFAEISSTLKLRRCSYFLEKNETTAKVVAELVSGEKTFPLRTLGDDGWVAVTNRLNGKKISTDQNRSDQSFDILVPQHRVDLKKDRLKDCDEVFYLVGTKVKPTDTSIAQLTAKEPLAVTLSETDIVGDFLANLAIMPVVERDEHWYFLMQYKKMIEEVRPIVEAAPIKQLN